MSKQKAYFQFSIFQFQLPQKIDTLAIVSNFLPESSLFLYSHKWNIFLPQDLGLMSAQNELVKRHFHFLTQGTFCLLKDTLFIFMMMLVSKCILEIIYIDNLIYYFCTLIFIYSNPIYFFSFLFVFFFSWETKCWKYVMKVLANDLFICRSVPILRMWNGSM